MDWNGIDLIESRLDAIEIYRGERDGEDVTLTRHGESWRAHYRFLDGVFCADARGRSAEEALKKLDLNHQTLVRTIKNLLGRG